MNRYLIDTRNLTIGFDTGSWALPLLVALGRFHLHVQILCVDIDVYWGEAAEQ